MKTECAWMARPQLLLLLMIMIMIMMIIIIIVITHELQFEPYIKCW